MDNRSDKELIRSYFKGEDEALKFLFGRHLDAVRFLAKTYVGEDEADDVVQEVFIRIWKNLKKFKSDGNFRAWALVIAKNCAIDHLRRHSKEIVFSDQRLSSDSDEVFDPADETPSILEELSKLSDKEILAAAINGLNDADRLVVLLRHSDELKFEEMAKVLGEPMNTVKNRYWRALKRLKLAIKD